MKELFWKNKFTFWLCTKNTQSINAPAKKKKCLRRNAVLRKMDYNSILETDLSKLTELLI